MKTKNYFFILIAFIVSGGFYLTVDSKINDLQNEIHSARVNGADFGYTMSFIGKSRDQMQKEFDN